MAGRHRRWGMTERVDGTGPVWRREGSESTTATLWAGGPSGCEVGDDTERGGGGREDRNEVEGLRALTTRYGEAGRASCGAKRNGCGRGGTVVKL